MTGVVQRRWLFACGAAVMALGVALALIYRPWLNAWWPGAHEAGALPAECPQLPGLPPPGIPTRLTGDVEGADCVWGTANGFPPLDARYSLFRRVENISGTAGAQRDAASHVTRYLGPEAGFTLGADSPVSGVGDEARFSEHGSLAILVARKSNVVLTVNYTEHEGKGQAQAILASYARTLLGLVELS